MSDKICGTCINWNDWWSPTDERVKCELSGDFIEEDGSCDAWEPNNEIELIENRDELQSLRQQLTEVQGTLERLACLGNGDKWGNSIGNIMAQDALRRLKG